MPIFYCRLAKESTKRVYQFLKKELKRKQENDFFHQTLVFNNKTYTICFRGKFINKEAGEMLLEKQKIPFKDDCEYLLALYQVCGNRFLDFIASSSFVLIDNTKTVFIYSGDPLYYTRKHRGEIYISSEKDYLDEDKIFMLDKQQSLFFYNDNLKALSGQNV